MHRKHSDCTAFWHKLNLSLHQKTKHKVMRNTEYSLEKLASMISSESSFNALMEIMGDMGLEFESAVRNA